MTPTQSGPEPTQALGEFKPGEQYAFIEGLLDPSLPYVTFVVELPVPVDTYVDERVVVPLSSLRTGASTDTEVRVQVTPITTKAIESAATVDRLLALADRTARDRAGWRKFKSRLHQPFERTTWVAELTTPNELLDSEQANDSEVAVKLLLRCLLGLNRLLSAYLVASEDYAVRPVRMEALDSIALVEFRDRRNRPLSFGGFLTLPKATSPDSKASMSGDEFALRMRTSLDHEMVKHPMDRVVSWEKRARFHSNIGGDYEMSIIALMVSAEALVTALWRTQQVDAGGDSSKYDETPRFREALGQVSRAYKDPWTRGGAGPVANFWKDCYEVRNETVHEGALIDHEILDVAFEAYWEFRQWVLERSLANSTEYPRTALMVHGPRGLEKEPTALANVAQTLGDIRKHDELAFWLPPDMPRSF